MADVERRVDARETDSLVSTLLEAAPSGFLIADLAGVIVRVNHRIEYMFGYDRSELVGQPVEMLIPADLRRRHLVHRRTYNAAPSVRPMGLGMSLLAVRKDGSEFPVEIALSPVDTADGSLVIAIVRDVTLRRRAEHERNALAIELETEQERQRIGMDLHDGVMQEIYATALTLELALDDIPAGEANDAARAGVERAIDQLHETTRNIRSYIFDLRPRQFTGDLSGAIQDLAHEFQQNSQIETRTEVEESLPSLDMDKAVALYLVVHEALSNVRKHAHAAHVTISLGRSRRALHLQVRDDGAGFDTSAETAQQHRGLRNMSARASAIGGRLQLESAPGQGTCVRVDLDVVTGSARRGSVDQASQAQAGVGQGPDGDDDE